MADEIRECRNIFMYNFACELITSVMNKMRFFEYQQNLQSTSKYHTHPHPRKHFIHKDNIYLSRMSKDREPRSYRHMESSDRDFGSTDLDTDQKNGRTTLVDGFPFLSSHDTDGIKAFIENVVVSGSNIFFAFEAQLMNISCKGSREEGIVQSANYAAIKIMDYFLHYSPGTFTSQELERGLLYGACPDFLVKPKSFKKLGKKWSVSTMYSQALRAILSYENTIYAVLQDGHQCSDDCIFTRKSYHGFRRLFPFEREIGNYHFHECPEIYPDFAMNYKYLLALETSSYDLATTADDNQPLPPLKQDVQTLIEYLCFRFLQTSFTGYMKNFEFYATIARIPRAKVTSLPWNDEEISQFNRQSPFRFSQLNFDGETSTTDFNSFYGNNENYGDKATGYRKLSSNQSGYNDSFLFKENLQY